MKEDGLSMKAEFRTVGIRVRDLEKSVDFYSKLVGMKIAGRGKVKQTKGEWVELATANNKFTLELNYYEEDSPYYSEYVLGEALDHLTFKVRDLEETLRKAEQAGYPVVDDHKQGKKRWTYIEDPNGIWIQFY